MLGKMQVQHTSTVGRGCPDVLAPVIHFLLMCTRALPEGVKLLQVEHFVIQRACSARLI